MTGVSRRTALYTRASLSARRRVWRLLLVIACAIAMVRPAEAQEAKPAQPDVAAANRAVPSQLPFDDRQDFEDANTRLHRHHSRSRQPRPLRLPQRRRAADRQSQPLARGPARCHQRPVQGRRRRLSDSRAVGRGHDHCGRQDRRHRDRHAWPRRAKRGPRSSFISRIGRRSRVNGGDLHPRSWRPLWRRQRGGLARRRGLRQSQSDRAAGFHGGADRGGSIATNLAGARGPIPVRRGLAGGRHAAPWNMAKARSSSRGPAGRRADHSAQRHHPQKPFETRTIDGVQFQFQLALDTEAPSEMFVYLPEPHVLDVGEDATPHVAQSSAHSRHLGAQRAVLVGGAEHRARRISAAMWRC